MKRQIKIGLSGLNASALIAKTEHIVAAMTGNANFPNPTPDLADLNAAKQALKDATRAAKFGDKRAILDRKDKEGVVKDLLRQLASYITMTANGDGAMIASSGFEVRRLPEPMPRLTRPLGFEAIRGEHSGTAVLEWKSVRGSQTYLIEVTTSDPGTSEAVWTTAAITTKVKHRIENLERGKYYWYRVMAIGRNTTSTYSDVSLLFAA